jgi:hypothetical protein
MNWLPVAIVEVAFAIALAAAIFAVVEWVALLRFSGWAFRIGPRVLLETVALPPLPQNLQVSLDTEHGQFKRIASNAVLFRPRTRGLSILDAFAVSGILVWDTDETMVDGRIPLATTLFVTSWLVGWGAISLVVWLSHANLLVVIGLAVVVPLVALAVVYVVLPAELRRLRRILDELAELLGAVPTKRTKGSRTR